MMVLALPSVARADTPEALYERAWSAMDRKDYVEACSLFDQSYAQSRATGPLQGLAACFEARGLLKQALQLWRDAERNLPPDSSSRVEVAGAVARLQPTVPLVTFKLSDDAPSSVRVELDGQVVTLDGAAIEIDPVVQHVVEVKATGHEIKKVTFRLAANERKTVVLDVGPALGSAQSSQPIGPVRATGIALTVLGGVSLGAAAITGGVMLSQASTIDEGCRGPEHTNCNDTALSASADADSLGPWNAAAWIVGLASLGAGIPMIVVGDGSPATESTAAISFQGTRVLLSGWF